MSSQTIPATPRERTETHPRDDESVPQINTVVSSIAKPRHVRLRRVVGLLLLGSVVFMWTASNFLASNILADRSYNKPYFVTYVNSMAFMIPLIPILSAKVYRDPRALHQCWRQIRKKPVAWIFKDTRPGGGRGYSEQETVPYRDTIRSPRSSLTANVSEEQASSYPPDRLGSNGRHDRLSLIETVRFGLQFFLVWFLPNYFVAASLEFTTVASSTILTSTSSIFTLAIGSYFGVERFTVRKVLGVLASFAGVALIASLDASGKNTDADHRGDFPEKSTGEILLGDALALISAVMYGAYSVMMKKRLGDESRVNMPLFFGLIGLFCMLFTWPGFLVLHFASIERFMMPPNKHVTIVILMNAAISLLADLAWAFAVLLTSPIVVSVGLTLTIPLSLIGQVIINGQTSSFAYWVGAAIVVLSFMVINREEEKEEIARVQEQFDEPEYRGSADQTPEVFGEEDRLLR